MRTVDDFSCPEAVHKKRRRREKTIRSANQVFFCFGVKVVGEKLESMDYEGNETDDHVVSHHVVEIGKCI